MKYGHPSWSATTVAPYLSVRTGKTGTLTGMDDSTKDRLNKAFARLRVYDRLGRRINYTEYRQLHDDHAYRFLARDKLGDLEVVTAWLGMDQGDADEPWVFGTVTLASDGTFLDDEEIFASTEDEATAHHAELLARRTAEHEASTGD